MKRIAIVAGGDQSEYEVSLRSADGIKSFFGADRYETHVVVLTKKEWKANDSGEWYHIDKGDFSYVVNGEKRTFDFAYVTIHGIPGEDGRLQGYFDLIGMPYSCCGVLAAALTYSKFFCNNFLKSFGVNVADSVLLRKGDAFNANDTISRIGLPLFVKPNDGGSSYGATKVRSEAEIMPAIEKAFGEADQVIIESFMKGTEVTCGMYKTADKTVVFPITEVVSKNDFFDYDAKYNGQVEEITPARLSAQLTARIQELSAKIYDLIGAKGIIRIDYIITEGDKINLLEVNTTPGMTPTSFIPQQVRAAKLNIADVLSEIVEDNLSLYSRKNR